MPAVSLTFFIEFAVVLGLTVMMSSSSFEFYFSRIIGFILSFFKTPTAQETYNIPFMCVSFLVLDTFHHIPLFHWVHGNKVTYHHISKYKQNREYIFIKAVGKDIFSALSTEFLQGCPCNIYARRQAYDTWAYKLQKWLYKPFSWNFTMLETERSQYTKFPFLFKKICLSRIDDNHKTYDDCKAYYDPCG